MTSNWKDLTMAMWLRRLGRVAGVAIVVLLFSAPVGVVQAALVWQPEIVDSLGNVGQDTSLALDADGHPHISYYDDTNGNLKYAAFNGTSWEIQIVDATPGRVGAGSSLALDSNGHPHISYYNANNHALKYATFDGSGWDISTVDSERFSGLESSLVLDSNDRPRISYTTIGSFPNISLKYAVFDGTRWGIEVVPTGDATPGRSTSLALVISDLPIICYTVNFSGGLACAFLLPDIGWHIEAARLGDDVIVLDPSLAVAGNYQPHISFHDGYSNNLMHVVFDGTDWKIQTVDTADHSGYSPSLQLDRGDRPHISYFDANLGNLKYAHFDGTDWQIQTVDGDVFASIGDDNSLALDSNGQPHISYFDYSNGDLKYAQLVLNDPPLVEAGGPYSGTEGSPISLDGSVSDSDNDELTTTWSYAIEGADPGTTCEFGDASQVDTTFTCSDDGSSTVTLTAHDGLTSPVAQSATVTISNVAPAVTLGDDVEITTADTFTGSGSFSDPGANDTHTATVNYGDGSGEQPLTIETDGSFDLSHTYQSADDYLLSVCVADDDDLAGGCDTLVVSVVNTAPTVAAGGSYAGAEGSPVSLDGAVSDPENDPLTTTWSYTVNSAGDGTTCAFDDTSAFDTTFTCTNDGSFTVTLTADDGVNPAVTDNANVTINNIAPAVEVGDDIELNEGGTATSTGSFTDPGLIDTHTATVDYGDGGGEQTLTLAPDGSFSLSHSYPVQGEYQVSVCVTDNDQGQGCDALEVRVHNVAPTVTLGDDVEIDEGDTFSGNGSFSDPGGPPSGTDTHTATVDYGDGAGQNTLTFDSNGSFSLSHAYPDDGQYTVEVCVTDDDWGHGCDALQVTVRNVAPTVSLGDDVEITLGDPFTASGSFTDPGVNDSHTATVDYGDGTGAQSLELDDDSFILSHTYLTKGVYQLSVCVTDSDGGAGCDDLQVTVINLPPTVETGGPFSGDEASPITIDGSVSDSENDPLTTAWSYQIDSADDGTSCTFGDATQVATTFTCTDDGTFILTLEVRDGINSPVSASTTVTVSNVAPTISEAVASLERDQVRITVTASDPSPNDTLGYAFDCDGDGSYELDASTTPSASCPFNQQLEGVFSFGVQVSDDDGGIATDTMSLTIATELCANDHTGVLRYSEQCQSHETAITIPDPDGPVTFCANDYNGLLRAPANGVCAGYETAYILPDDGPLNVCVSTHTQTMRLVDDLGRCSSNEFARVIAATEVGEIPAARRS